MVVNVDIIDPILWLLLSKRSCCKLHDGIFMVRMCIKYFTEISVRSLNSEDMHTALNPLWEIKAPSNSLHFGWQYIINRIPTKDLLVRRRILQDSIDFCCVFCFKEEDTKLHLFEECEWAFCQNMEKGFRLDRSEYGVDFGWIRRIFLPLPQLGAFSYFETMSYLKEDSIILMSVCRELILAPGRGWDCIVSLLSCVILMSGTLYPFSVSELRVYSLVVMGGISIILSFIIIVSN